MVWGDKTVRHVDFQDMKKDEDGKWYAHKTSWRIRHVKDFVSGLRAANRSSVIEIVAVGHGSFFRKFVGEPWDGESRDGEWEAAQCRSFSDENGNLMELTEDEIRDEDWIVPYLTRSRKSGNRRA
jgi:hypothetical protein